MKILFFKTIKFLLFCVCVVSVAVSGALGGIYFKSAYGAIAGELAGFAVVVVVMVTALDWVDKKIKNLEWSKLL